MIKRLWKKLLLYVTGCCVMLAMPAGCAPVSQGDFCSLYKPVYTAAGDTPETKDSADINNAVWLELCQKEQP